MRLVPQFAGLGWGVPDFVEDGASWVKDKAGDAYEAGKKLVKAAICKVASSSYVQTAVSKSAGALAAGAVVAGGAGAGVVSAGAGAAAGGAAAPLAYKAGEKVGKAAAAKLAEAACSSGDAKKVVEEAAAAKPRDWALGSAITAGRDVADCQRGDAEACKRLGVPVPKTATDHAAFKAGTFKMMAKRAKKIAKEQEQAAVATGAPGAQAGGGMLWVAAAAAAALLLI